MCRRHHYLLIATTTLIVITTSPFFLQGVASGGLRRLSCSADVEEEHYFESSSTYSACSSSSSSIDKGKTPHSPPSTFECPTTNAKVVGHVGDADDGVSSVQFETLFPFKWDTTGIPPPISDRPLLRHPVLYEILGLKKFGETASSWRTQATAVIRQRQHLETRCLTPGNRTAPVKVRVVDKITNRIVSKGVCPLSIECKPEVIKEENEYDDEEGREGSDVDDTSNSDSAPPLEENDMFVCPTQAPLVRVDNVNSISVLTTINLARLFPAAVGNLEFSLIGFEILDHSRSFLIKSLHLDIPTAALHVHCFEKPPTQHASSEGVVYPTARATLGILEEETQLFSECTLLVACAPAGADAVAQDNGIIM